jgi:hypothetical protein
MSLSSYKACTSRRCRKKEVPETAPALIFSIHY